MRVLNFGSLNIDHVYRVPHIVRPGETLSGNDYAVFAGGKGANQSVALARAGATVAHGGRIGRDGEWILETLVSAGVDCSFVAQSDDPTGHAIIQIDAAGQNAIFLFGGGNKAITTEQVDVALAAFSPGDILLLQNEINHVPYLMRMAHERGLRICFNPAPYGPEVQDYPLDLVDLLVLNETEGADLTGADQDDPDAVMDALLTRFSGCEMVLTLGADGVLYGDGEERVLVRSPQVEVVDTTAAGDTFIGYFLACRLENMTTRAALETACNAAAICVSRSGAIPAIPSRDELRK